MKNIKEFENSIFGKDSISTKIGAAYLRTILNQISENKPKDQELKRLGFTQEEIDIILKDSQYPNHNRLIEIIDVNNLKKEYLSALSEKITGLPLYLLAREEVYGEPKCAMTKENKLKESIFDLFLDAYPKGKQRELLCEEFFGCELGKISARFIYNSDFVLEDAITKISRVNPTLENRIRSVIESYKRDALSDYEKSLSKPSKTKNKLRLYAIDVIRESVVNNDGLKKLGFTDEEINKIDNMRWPSLDRILDVINSSGLDRLYEKKLSENILK